VKCASVAMTSLEKWVSSMSIYGLDAPFTSADYADFVGDWGDALGEMAAGALVPARGKKGRRCAGPWCALCQCPVSQCITSDGIARHVRCASPGSLCAPSAGSRPTSRMSCDPGRASAMSHASVVSSRAASPQPQGRSGRASPYADELPSRAAPLPPRSASAMGSTHEGERRPEKPSRAATGLGSSSYGTEHRRETYVEFMHGRRYIRPAHIRPVNDMKADFSSVSKQDDVVSVFRLRDLMGSGVVCRVDAHLEEEDKARRAYDAEVRRRKRNENLKALTKKTREWQRCEARRKANRRKYLQENVQRQEHKSKEHVESPVMSEAGDEGDVVAPHKTCASIWDRRVSAEKVVAAISHMGSGALRRLSNTNCTQSIAEEAEEVPLASDDRFDVVALRKEEEEQDIMFARAAFRRYDNDKSARLEFREVRAILGDLRLMPQTPEEKAGFRTTLVHMTLGMQDGHTDSEHDDDDDDEKEEEEESHGISFRERLRRLGGEKKVASSIALALDELPSLLARVRKRLKTCRERVYRELFGRYDIFDRGELDFGTIKTLLQHEGWDPKTEKEQARFHDLVLFLRQRRVTLLQTSHSATLKAKTHKTQRVKKARSRVHEQEAHCIKEPTHKKVTMECSTEEESQSDCVEEERSSPRKLKSSKSTIKPCTRREMRSDTAGKFPFPDFEVLMEFIREGREQCEAEEQRNLAFSLGLLPNGVDKWASSGLFIEFRNELEKCHELFLSFDVDFSGFLEVDEIWEALMRLGLMPKRHADKSAVLQIVADTCADTRVAELRTRRKGRKVDKKGSAIALMCLFLYSEEKAKEDTQMSSTIDQENWLEEMMSDDQHVDFKGFLILLSKTRAWHHQSMKEELLPIFEKRLKRRNTAGATLSIPDVCKALEDFNLAPSSAQEQEKIKELIEAANEWGFEPACFDFEAFVKFIFKVREWRNSEQKAREKQYAWENLEIDERTVTTYRMAFDLLDTEARDELDITMIRRIFVVLRRPITSDQLRELFAKIDLDGSGTIGFLEFLHLVHEVGIYEAPKPPTAPKVSRKKKQVEDDWEFAATQSVSFAAARSITQDMSNCVDD